jgi:DNA-binding XRE family transcriptional regulator
MSYMDRLQKAQAERDLRARRLRAVRAWHGWSQAEAAAQFRLSRETLQRIERGKRCDDWTLRSLDGAFERLGVAFSAEVSITFAQLVPASDAKSVPPATAVAKPESAAAKSVKGSKAKPAYRRWITADKPDHVNGVTSYGRTPFAEGWWYHRHTREASRGRKLPGGWSPAIIPGPGACGIWTWAKWAWTGAPSPSVPMLRVPSIQVGIFLAGRPKAAKSVTPRAADAEASAWSIVPPPPGDSLRLDPDDAVLEWYWAVDRAAGRRVPPSSPIPTKYIYAFQCRGRAPVPTAATSSKAPGRSSSKSRPRRKPSRSASPLMDSVFEKVCPKAVAANRKRGTA